MKFKTMLYSKQDLIQALSKVIIKQNLAPEISVNKVVIDGRGAFAGSLFVAIKGENNDGHDFIEQAFGNGCEIALVQDENLFQATQNRNLILVKDTFEALYELAKFARQKSKARIIAVTGSVGKTSTKEMLKEAFQVQGKTYATFGNLNNHYGVPLTLCNMSADCEFAIIEMGMNHVGEIEPLSKLARPHLAVITEITSAHIGNFNNEEEIAYAKSEIFSGLEPQGIALINGDNIYLDILTKRAIFYGVKEENIMSFGKNLKSDYCLKSIENQGPNLSKADVEIKNKGEIFYTISSINKIIIANSLISVACLDLFSCDIEKCLKAFENLEMSKGRGALLELKFDDKNISIIDDSYNANIASMKAAIDYLCDLKQALNKNRAIAILGDMFELGSKSDEIHDQVLRYASTKSVDLIIVAGENMKKATKVLDKNFKIYLNAKDIALDLKNLIQDNDILLIKGSRAMRMEEVIKH